MMQVQLLQLKNSVSIAEVALILVFVALTEQRGYTVVEKRDRMGGPDKLKGTHCPRTDYLGWNTWS